MNDTALSTEQYEAIYDPSIDSSEAGLTTEGLFDIEVWSLLEKGFHLPKQDIESLRHALLAKAAQTSLEESLRFIVIPRQRDSLHLDILMKLVQVDDKTGLNSINASSLFDRYDVTPGSHLFLDVDDGRNRMDSNIHCLASDIHEENRCAYTTWHGLIHAILFPCVLQHHGMDLVGSYYYHRHRTPGIGLVEHTPLLASYWATHIDTDWGAPSAGTLLYEEAR